jgi:hypothetical protein
MNIYAIKTIENNSWYNFFALVIILTNPLNLKPWQSTQKVQAKMLKKQCTK